MTYPTLSGASSYTSFESTNTASASITGISNTSRAFIAFGFWGDGRYSTSVTYGGQSLSLIARATYPSYFVCEVMGLLNAPTGSNTLSYTLNGNSSGNIVAVQFYGTRGWSTTNTASNLGTSITTTLSNLVGGDLAVSGINHFNGAITNGDGQSYIASANAYGCYSYITYKQIASAGSTDFSYTFANSDKNAHALFNLLPTVVVGTQAIWWN